MKLILATVAVVAMFAGSASARTLNIHSLIPGGHYLVKTCRPGPANIGVSCSSRRHSGRLNSSGNATVRFLPPRVTRPDTFFWVGVKRRHVDLWSCNKQLTTIRSGGSSVSTFNDGNC